MQVRFFSVVLLSLALGSAAFAQQQSEPEAPTIQETVDYINNHAIVTYTLNGTELSWRSSVHKNDCSFDIMNIRVAYHDFTQPADTVSFQCLSNLHCILISPRQGDDKHEFDVSVLIENGSIQGNMVRAFNHLFQLVKQHNRPANDPFGPKN